MALVKCGECGNQVSTAAAACPKCGAPVGASSQLPPLATVQRTSKPLKAQGCLSMLLVIIGLFICLIGASAPNGGAGAGLGAILLVIGLIWAVITRIRIWWHHD